MDGIDLAQDRDQWRAFIKTVMNLQVPQGVGNLLSSCTTGSFSRRDQLRGVSLAFYSTAHPNNIFNRKAIHGKIILCRLHICFNMFAALRSTC
jgi:hypothetical protein